MLIIKNNLLRAALVTAFSLNLEAQEAPHWHNSSQIPVQTVFYQGMGCAQTQGAKYTGTRGFIATTGEHVVCKKGADLIQNLYCKPEIEEVIPASLIATPWLHYFYKPTTIAKAVFHWLTRRSHVHYNIEVTPPASATIPETIDAYSLDIGKVNLGQEGDIQAHILRYTTCRQEHPNSDIIAYGVSRGAATTFQSLAQLSAQKQDISPIKLCVLEGCFDTIANVVTQWYPRLLYYSKSRAFLTALASKIISFKIDGPSPLAAADNFPKTVPVAFITSLKDIDVSHVLTKNVISELIKKGHPCVYLLQLQHSSHPRYMFDHDQDTKNYTYFMHALYAQYHLPHIPYYAQKGKDLLEQSKITSIQQLH